jgi:FkbM family methyltransferase
MFPRSCWVAPTAASGWTFKDVGYFHDILMNAPNLLLIEAAGMSLLTGPRMYYSLLGPFGVFLGAKARLLGRKIEVAVEIAGVRHPVHLRVRTTDVLLCQQILLDAQYDSTLAVRPQVVVDAGANIGLASIFYANRYPEAKIVAIEPEPSNYEMLRKNVALYPNIVPIHAALWSENKMLSGSSVDTGHHAYQVSKENELDDQGHCGTVRGLTLRELMTDLGIQQIDLLKVDIEGSEKEVFQNSADWIGHVGIIAIEIHEWIRSGCNESVYGAAKDFGVRWQRGETTYFAKAGTVESGEAHRNPRLISMDVGTRPRSRFPLKIVHVM